MPNEKVYRYFPRWELQCPHCGVVDMDDEAMAKLVRARHNAGIAFRLSSAYRCPEYNRSEAIGGVPNSSHELGCGFDIYIVGSRQRWTTLTHLIEAGFHRIGIYAEHIHVDDNKDADPRVVWYGE